MYADLIGRDPNQGKDATMSDGDDSDPESAAGAGAK
jgi:hypothetical protein